MYPCPETRGTASIHSHMRWIERRSKTRQSPVVPMNVLALQRIYRTYRTIGALRLNPVGAVSFTAILWSHGRYNTGGDGAIVTH